MKNFMKRMSLVLTSAIMAGTMVVSASAASANQNTSCSNNSAPTVKYYASSSGCLSNSDLNALLAKLGISGKTFTLKSSANCPTDKNTAVQGNSTSSPIPAQGSGTSGKATKSSSGNVSTPAPSATQGAVNSSADNSSFEAQVVTLVNQQRASNGLKPLTLNTQLSNMATAKAQDMHDNNYFSHTSPVYGSPFDMMNSFGISYSAAGENIAMGYASPQAVMNAWMNSPGHRANILNPSYTQIGIGYCAAGNYWTQEFIG